MATILVVDDERMICDLLRATFCRHGHEVLTATRGDDGLEVFKQRRPNVTLLDLHMPGLSGIEVLKKIRSVDQQAKILILTGRGTDKQESQAQALGVTGFLKKGLSLDVIVDALYAALSKPETGASAASPDHRA
jgi:DNA-binding response OmpR family regulator